MCHIHFSLDATFTFEVDATFTFDVEATFTTVDEDFEDILEVDGVEEPDASATSRPLRTFSEPITRKTISS